jgi:hypothetical protein
MTPFAFAPCHQSLIVPVVAVRLVDLAGRQGDAGFVGRGVCDV